MGEVNAIRARMDELGMSVRDLAHHLKLTRQRVYQLLDGIETSYHQNTINTLCDVLACKESDLFEVREVIVRRRLPKRVAVRKYKAKRKKR